MPGVKAPEWITPTEAWLLCVGCGELRGPVSICSGSLNLCSAVLGSILQAAISTRQWASVEAAVAASLRSKVSFTLEMLETLCDELDKIDGRLFEKLFAAFAGHPQAKVWRRFFVCLIVSFNSIDRCLFLASIDGVP
jgi:hypothetical protein